MLQNKPFACSTTHTELTDGILLHEIMTFHFSCQWTIVFMLSLYIVSNEQFSFSFWKRNNSKHNQLCSRGNLLAATWESRSTTSPPPRPESAGRRSPAAWTPSTASCMIQTGTASWWATNARVSCTKNASPSVTPAHTSPTSSPKQHTSCVWPVRQLTQCGTSARCSALWARTAKVRTEPAGSSQWASGWPAASCSWSLPASCCGDVSGPSAPFPAREQMAAMWPLTQPIKTCLDPDTVTATNMPPTYNIPSFHRRSPAVW